MAIVFRIYRIIGFAKPPLLIEPLHEVCLSFAIIKARGKSFPST